jgi:hypothetical protein
MTENLKLPRKLSEERKSPPPQRPSHADVIEKSRPLGQQPGASAAGLVREKRA